MIEKVLLIASWYPLVEKPQSGNFFKTQAELLSEKYEVKVLVCDTVPIGKKSFIASLFKKPKSKYTYLQSDKFEVLDFAVPELVFLSEKQRFTNLFSSFCKKLVSLFKTWKPDIIHAHDVWTAGVIAQQVSAQTNIPYVLTSHTPIFLNTRSSFVNTLFLHAIEKSNQFTTVGNQDKRIIDSIINLKKKTITIGNIIDTELFNPKNKVAATTDGFKIVQITSTSLRKDVPTFLKAIKEFIAKYKPEKKIEVVLIVTSIQEAYSLEDIIKQIKELHLENIITLKSDLLIEDIATEFKTTHLYISTSFYETFGLTVAEATAMGVPIITVDNGAVRDFIRDGENGLITESGDYKKIAECIFKVYDNHIIFDENKLHHSIATKYSREVYLNKLIAIYEDVVSD